MPAVDLWDESCAVLTVAPVDCEAGAEPADCAAASAGIEIRTARARNFFIEMILTGEFPCLARIHG